MLVGSQLIDSGLKNPFYTLLIKLLSNKSQYEERMDKFLAEINKIKIDPLQIISNKQKFDIEGKNTLTPSIRNIKNSEYKDFNDYELKEFEEKALNEQLLIKNNQDFIDYYLIHKATMKNYLSENELVVEFHGKVIRLYDYNVSFNFNI